ncbi:MAG: response regulator [Candidatus Latescibacterota bacterium]|jgi:CheY-like chemotaxis protein
MVEKAKKTVLVVDDEPDIRLYMKTVLENAGFDVSVAANGKEALDRMTEKKPDVISLDLVMPKMSGLKFYRYIQKNKDRADVPVVVVTAHAKDEFGKADLEKIRAAKTGDGKMVVVEKPIDPVDYVNAIRRALGMDELASEATSEKDVLRVKLKEKMKTADREALENALRILEEGTDS